MPLIFGATHRALAGPRLGACPGLTGQGKKPSPSYREGIRIVKFQPQSPVSGATLNSVLHSEAPAGGADHGRLIDHLGDTRNTLDAVQQVGSSPFVGQDPLDMKHPWAHPTGAKVLNPWAAAAVPNLVRKLLDVCRHRQGGCRRAGTPDYEDESAGQSRTVSLNDFH